MREWLPVLASALDAKPPRRVPRWLGRLAAGEAATVMMTEARGASNAKAKRELGWQLRYPSWRQGFAHGTRLSDDRPALPDVADRGAVTRLTSPADSWPAIGHTSLRHVSLPPGVNQVADQFCRRRDPRP